MKRILILDDLYPEFLAGLHFDKEDGYETALRKVLGLCFGTFDAFSRHLRQLGWIASDIIVNSSELQNRWARENHAAGDILLAQIADFRPDVLFFQNLSICDANTLARLRKKYILAGQCSCRLAAEENIRQFHILFSSFPFYVPLFESMGVHAVYLPLAFDPSIVMGKTFPTLEREIDIAFVGGVGNPSYWQYGMEVLDAVARQVPTSFFWGYGYDTLPADSPIRYRYRGDAFGLRMYSILQHSKMAIARHGEVARGYANNLKMFETTGCGALLLTEQASNLNEFFADNECVAYISAQDAVDKIKYYLEHDDERREIAMRGQERTMRDHTYTQRIPIVSKALLEML